MTRKNLFFCLPILLALVQLGGAQKKRSGKDFDELFPEGKPWSITYTKEDWLLGNVVPIKALTGGLREIESKALEIEAAREGCDGGAT